MRPYHPPQLAGDLHADGLRIHMPMRKSTLRVEQRRSFERFHSERASSLLVPSGSVHVVKRTRYFITTALKFQLRNYLPIWKLYATMEYGHEQ